MRGWRDLKEKDTEREQDREKPTVLPEDAHTDRHEEFEQICFKNYTGLEHSMVSAAMTAPRTLQFDLHCFSFNGLCCLFGSNHSWVQLQNERISCVNLGPSHLEDSSHTKSCLVT